jgi:hypothetical protein
MYSVCMKKEEGGKVLLLASAILLYIHLHCLIRKAQPIDTTLRYTLLYTIRTIYFSANIRYSITDDKYPKQFKWIDKNHLWTYIDYLLT